VEELAAGGAGAQSVTVGAPDTLASWKRRMKAGRTWEDCRSKLSLDPYRFVGIAEIQSRPHSVRWASM
jgi:hypothetical protein